jgi:hypothetical protein
MQRTPHYWHDWKQRCKFATNEKEKVLTPAEMLEQEMAKANENDWLVTTRPTRDELIQAQQINGEKIPSLDGTSKFEKTRSHNFGLASKRWVVEEERPPSPPFIQAPSSIGTQSLSTMRSGRISTLSKSSRRDWKNTYAGREIQKKSGFIPQKNPGPGAHNYCDSLDRQVVSTKRTLPKYSLPTAARSTPQLETTPGAIYEPTQALLATKPNPRGHRFPLGGRSTSQPAGCSPGPKYMPKLDHGKGTTFADIWQQKPKAASQLKGLKARGCYGFGYESNLEEVIL